MKKLMLNTGYLFFSFITLSLINIPQTSYASYIRFLDVRVDNESEYHINNIEADNDYSSIGYLQAIHANSVAPGESVNTASFSTTLLSGHLSQNLVFDLADSDGEKIGSCKMHVGIGSYIARPDFTGSECKLTNNDYIQLNPRYEISYNSYKVYFRVSKSKNFSRIFVFGDSMSDNGNLYKRSVEISLIFPISPILPISPPYFKGRFTNGKVWVERLADKFNIPAGSLIDYAYAGARVKKDMFPIPTLDKQVTSYINWNNSGDPYALYTVWIGSNDLLRETKQSDYELLNTIRDGIEYNIRRLIDHGAKYILSPQLPDLSVTPDSINKDLENGNTSYSVRLRTLINKYNSQHLKLLIRLQREFPDVQFITFDFYKFIQEARDHAHEYGFTNITSRCNPNGYWDDNLDICEKPREYVYWDGVHPSATAHAIIAEIIFAKLTSEGYEPNNNYIAKNMLPDAVVENNKDAIDELNKDIERPNKTNKTNKSKAANDGVDSEHYDFSSLLVNSVPLY